LEWMFQKQYMHFSRSLVNQMISAIRHSDDWMKYVLEQKDGLDLMLSNMECEVDALKILKFLERENLLNLTEEKYHEICFQLGGTKRIDFLLDRNLISMDRLFRYTMQQKERGNAKNIFHALKRRGFPFNQRTDEIREHAHPNMMRFLEDEIHQEHDFNDRMHEWLLFP
jgi:hypothetical protein